MNKEKKQLIKQTIKDYIRVYWKLLLVAPILYIAYKVVRGY